MADDSASKASLNSWAQAEPAAPGDGEEHAAPERQAVRLVEAAQVDMKDMIKPVLVVLAVSVSLAAPVAAGSVEDATDAWDRKDYATALRLSRPLAEQGNAVAQYYLGVMYDNGQGVPQDYAEALKWYRKAAEQGDATAQNNLGMMYHLGQGVPQDYAEALKWYRKAAEQGDATAQSNLGATYDSGQGVPQDDAEAVNWYRKAADQGDTMAQNNLGAMYDRGEGVPQDDLQAYKWMSLAVANWPASATEGREWVAARRGKVSARMTPAQIAEAEKLVREWKPAKGTGRATPVAAGSVEDATDAWDRKDYATALRLSRPLAEQGNAVAQFYLGNMYLRGKGVPHDYAEARKWLRGAADQGYPRAQLFLGLMYGQGDAGVAQDYVQAYMWLKLAAVQLSHAPGREHASADAATIALYALAAKMTPAQIAEAEKLVRKWKPTNGADR